ncbi:MAG: hypothetical protein WCD49_03635 [Candidatus Acidiferrales bacterium]
MFRLYQIAAMIFAVTIGACAAQAQQQPSPDQSQQPQQAQQPQQPDQQQGAEQPIPAYKSPLASQADNGESITGPTELSPDNTPLTGIQNLSLGVPLDRHSYWQPHAEVDFVGDSEPPDGGVGSWTAWSTVIGGVDVHRYSSNSQLTFDYLGGGVFSTDGNIGNGIIQDANLDAQFTFRRWTLTFIDELRYTPELAFGNIGFGGISTTIGVPIGLPFGGDQTILSEFGQRLTNATAVQADVQLSPRSSLTFSAGYSELYFFDQDLLNSTEIYAQAGYNHRLSRLDSIGLSYVYNGFRFSNFAQSIDTHTALLSYGRRVTGRLAFQIAAGPQYALFATGLSCGVTATACGSTSELLWSLNTTLSYQLERTGFFATYSHGVTGGSGILAGAIGDTVLGTVTRQITRTLRGDAELGYARNSGLEVAIANLPILNGTFDYWSAGAHLTHPIGRTFQLIFGYDFQYQNSNSPFCEGTNCGGSYTRNLISVGLAWRGRPRAF